MPFEADLLIPIEPTGPGTAPCLGRNRALLWSRKPERNLRPRVETNPEWRRAMSKIEVRREHGPKSGRYVLDTGDGEAELTYTRVAPDMVRADHTGVPVALRGRGLAALLVERLVTDARAEGFRIRPACSYVEAQRQRHPEWADAF